MTGMNHEQHRAQPPLVPRSASPRSAAACRSGSACRSMPAAAAETAPTGVRPRSTPGLSIRPDDTVVIRIARSEMGQGTLTGLAQLVAEELECDWSKVTTEFPTPGENAARKRVWGNFSTGGSRGIRELHEYVRKGGAAARDMLIRAAAAEWGVPPGRVQRREQRHHARAVGPDDELRQGGRGGRQARPAAASRRSRTRRTGRSPASR